MARVNVKNIYLLINIMFGGVQVLFVNTKQTFMILK
jgi:hypothetical protein